MNRMVLVFAPDKVLAEAARYLIEWGRWPIWVYLRDGHAVPTDILPSSVPHELAYPFHLLNPEPGLPNGPPAN